MRVSARARVRTKVNAGWSICHRVVNRSPKPESILRREGLLSLHTLLFAKPRSKPIPEPLRVNDATVDHIEDGIYRIRIMTPDAPISFNKFLIDDERPALPSLSPSAPTAR